MSNDTQEYPTPTDPFDALPAPEEAHGQALESEQWDKSVDYKAAEKTARDAQLPGGTYQTIPELKLMKKKYDDGRRVAMFFGQVIGAGRNNEGEEGRVMFSMSPDRVDKKDDPGKPDNKSKLWSHAVLAYKKVFEGEPETEQAVLDYIQKYPIRVRGFAGTGDFIITDISEVRE